MPAMLDGDLQLTLLARSLALLSRFWSGLIPLDRRADLDRSCIRGVFSEHPEHVSVIVRVIGAHQLRRALSASLECVAI